MRSRSTFATGTTVDAGSVARIEAAGIKARAVPLMMTDHDATAAMAAEAIDLAGR